MAADFYPPQITITAGSGMTATYVDTGHVLDTGGFDGACAGDESHPWTPLTTVTSSPFNVGGQWSVTGTVTSGPQAGLSGGGTLVIDQVYGASQFTGSFTLQTTAGTVSGNIEDGTVSADTLQFLAVAGTLQDQVTVDLSTAGVTQMAGTWQDSLGNRGTMVATRSLRLSLAASTASAQVEQAVYLTAKLTDAGGYPIGGQPVDLRVIYASDAGVGLSAQTLLTDASGEGVFTVTNDLPGTVTLQALYPGLAAATTVTWSGEVVISRVLLTASPSFIPADGLTPATLTATVYGGSGQLLKGIPVTFTSTLGVLSSSLTSEQFTNAAGEAGDELTTGQVGQATVTVSVYNGPSRIVRFVAATPGTLLSAQAIINCVGPTQSYYVPHTWSNPIGFGSNSIEAYKVGAGDLQLYFSGTRPFIVLDFGRQTQNAAGQWEVQLKGGQIESQAWVEKVAQAFVAGYDSAANTGGNGADWRCTVVVGTNNGDYPWSDTAGAISPLWAQAGADWADMVNAIRTQVGKIPGNVCKVEGGSDIESWLGPRLFGSWVATGAATEQWVTAYNWAFKGSLMVDYGSDGYAEDSGEWTTTQTMAVADGHDVQSLDSYNSQGQCDYCKDVALPEIYYPGQASEWVYLCEQFYEPLLGDYPYIWGVTSENGWDGSLAWGRSWQALYDDFSEVWHPVDGRITII